MRIAFRKQAPALTLLAVLLATPGAFAGTVAHASTSPAAGTTPAAASATQTPVDFDPGLWREVVDTHIWEPFSKHQIHKECWQTPTPQITDKETASKCRDVKIARDGNTFTVDETCPMSGDDTHLHISRTYAGNTATETGTIKLKGVTAHIKARAKRIGQCPPKPQKQDNGS